MKELVVMRAVLRCNALKWELCLCAVVTLAAPTALGQVDPGPRGGPPAAGGFYPTLNAAEQALFSQAFGRFQEVQSVTGSIAGEDSLGLGPAFNGNSCTMCHAQPTIGGSSPGLKSPQNPIPNPQVALATLDGATNGVPPFITADGPVREARFVSTDPTKPNAPLDGSVHDLYTIAGRVDAPGCTLAQPDFATQLAEGNVVLRIPTPLFGLGLVENTPDSVLQANLAANAAGKSALGIAGRLNTSGNDQTVTRFGWKAQNKSVLVFAGEAYNVEQGVANELFPNERSAVAGCVFNSTPEDSASLTAPDGSSTGTTSEMLSDTANFAIFIRLSAPPTPAPFSPSAQNGSTLFNSVGCALCHSTSMTTAAALFTGMSTVTYHPYSDFALHHMGSALADGVSQGNAGPDEFRTAPLWGVGQRLFFLHDGRTADLLQAIEAHQGPKNGCTPVGARAAPNGPSSGRPTCSEANAVIDGFNALSASQQQDILNFLRAL